MAPRPLVRLRHIKEYIGDIRRLLEGKTETQIADNKVARLALERPIELISEASRHIPDAWKESSEPAVPWQEVAAIGNVLRHVYDRVELSVLWSVYENDLDPLEAAVDAMLAAHDK